MAEGGMDGGGGVIPLPSCPPPRLAVLFHILLFHPFIGSLSLLAPHPSRSPPRFAPPPFPAPRFLAACLSRARSRPSTT